VKLAIVAMPAVWTSEALRPANIKQPLLTQVFTAITLNKGMNIHAFLKLNLILGHDLTLQNRIL
jgi:hypothetical protein